MVGDPADLRDCYEHSVAAVRLTLERGFAAESIIVDYTGGTKSMSAAVALAAVARGCAYSYVSGTQRTKRGLGIVVSGSEEVRTGLSPWTLFAVEERRRITALFDRYQFAGARLLCDELLERADVDHAVRLRVEAYRLLAEGYAEWDRFNHARAIAPLERARESLQRLVQIAGAESGDEALLLAIENAVRLLKAIVQEVGRDRGTPGPLVVADLWANARRRGEEGKYDDAVARLYRLVELAGQIAARELGIASTANVPVEAIPAPLRGDYVARHQDPRDGKIRLGLVATFELLKAAGHSAGRRYAEQEKALERVLTGRNQSILAHGVVPASRERYDEFAALVASWVGAEEACRFPKLGDGREAMVN